MEKDFLKDLGFLGVTARLKRLSDTLSYSIKELYSENLIDIEPSWHLVFLILNARNQSTMTEIAEALQLSQPAMTKMINRMVNKNYIEVTSDQYDRRKKILQLSGKAKKQLPKFEVIWNAGEKSIKEILESNLAFFDHLEEFEKQINRKSFKDRALRYLRHD